LGLDEFGDAEIEEFYGAILFDEDVAGFEIAMDDEVLVGVMDGGAYGEEEAEARGDIEFVVVAVFVDGDALDVLHDEVREAFGGGSTVEEEGDVGVIEVGEDLTFAAEAFEDLGVFAIAEDEFDGDLFAVLIVGAGGEVDGSHAATADFAENFVLADAGGWLHFSLVEELGDGVDGGFVEEGGFLGVGLEHGFDGTAEFGVGAAGVVEVMGAMGGGQFQGALEDGLYGLISFRSHGLNGLKYSE